MEEISVCVSMIVGHGAGEGWRSQGEGHVIEAGVKG